MKAVDDSWLEGLFRRHLLLVTGKGGTGKSTCAAALSLLAARRGLRPLFVEVESSSAARSIFGLKGSGLRPRSTGAGVDVVKVGFQSGLEALVHDVMKVPRVVRVVLRHPVISRFLRATPSALDFITLFLVTRFVESELREGEPAHPLVIVDMPAFGHSRQMLSVGRNIKQLLRVGPMAARGELIDEVVHDADRTAVVVVTLPEEMPVTETLEGYHALGSELGVPLGPVVVNCMHPERLDRQGVEWVEAAAVAAEADGASMSAEALRYGAERSRWAAARRRRIDGLRRALPEAEIVEVPLFPGAVAGMELTELVARALVSEGVGEVDGAG